MADAKRLNPFQHALLRPENYIGPVVGSNQECWVFNSETNTFEQRNIFYNPGLERIFVEIKSNVEDNRWRSEQAGVAMKKVEIVIDNDPDSETYGVISIKNDGAWISAEQKEYIYEDYTTGTTTTTRKYPAEIMFGEMLASTNFTNDDTRKTSGRNGIGAKATNIFSKYFEVEHVDPTSKRLFRQYFSDNGKTRSEPEIEKYTSKIPYTKITFLPDYDYFKYPGMDQDLFDLFTRHIYECAMITGLSVIFNGEKVCVKNLESYARMYFPEKSNSLLSFTSATGDECVIVESGIPTVNEQTSPNCISFINGIYTAAGGKHVDAWVDKIFPMLVREFNSRKIRKGAPETKTSAKKLYPYFTVFVRAEVAGPGFESQSKNKLVSPEIVLCSGTAAEVSKFNETIKEKVAKMMKWEFIGYLEEKLNFEHSVTSSKKEKTTSGNTGISLGKKATDANQAGKRNSSEKCTLFITEGDSAKTFADRLITKMPNGRDYFGSFAIKGKFINVQKESTKRVNENAEIQQIKKILNLGFGIDYSIPEYRKTLRYGKVCIVSDADDDGIHIRGLLLNFFYKYWPQLFTPLDSEIDTFFQSFSTAVTMVKSSNKDVQMFYSNPSFKKWYETYSASVENGGDKIRGLKIKYYKGLGTHDPKDIELYLKNGMHMLNYKLDGNEVDYMNLGFTKDSTEMRKAWITKDIKKPDENVLEHTTNSLTPEVEYQTKGDISLSDFVYDQLLIYHKMSLTRAIPNMYDGFKESQRKIFYGIQKDSDAKNDCVNLENLVGSIKKATGYHHGAKSLEDSVKKMAMGFIGSNNIPLLVPGGEFGTRENGGSGAAAARYISTKLEKISGKIFREEDEPCYTRHVEDNVPVEYEYYVPILPMVLINGADGIASGFSTSIPCYNPSEIVLFILEWLQLNPEDDVLSGRTIFIPNFEKMLPWYRGFTGEIYENNGDIYTKGIMTNQNNGWWHISEAPIGLWTGDLKSHLDYLKTGTHPDSDKKKKLETKLITEYQHGNCSINEVSFYIKPSADFVPNIDDKRNKFAILKNKISMNNIVVLDENGFPRRYKNVEDLISDFCRMRIKMYKQRKDAILAKLKDDIFKNENKLLFVQCINDGRLYLNKIEEEVTHDMKNLEIQEWNGNYEYLLSMGVRACTSNRITKLEKEISDLKNEYERYLNLTLREIWEGELREFLEEWVKFQKDRYND